jgi:uroporphyrin-III C-methyltransferase
MANQTEPEQSVPLTEQQERAVEEPIRDKPSTGASLIIPATAAIAVFALFISGYNLYANNDATKQTAKANERLAADVRQLKQQHQALVEQLKEKMDALEKTTHSFNEKINNFNNQIQIISTQKNNKNQDWLLLKVRYYLELAQINAHWSVNSQDESTLTLLQQADTILAQIKTTELFKVRQIMAKEILQLKEENTLDVPGLLSQLDALQNRIITLNGQSLSFYSVAKNVDPAPSLTDATWKSRLQNSFNMLKALVVVRRNDESIKPLLSPIYESLLKESIRLNIQEAQWAIINTNTTAYQFALKQAIITIQRGFNDHQTNTTAVIQQLADLQKINLTQEKPNVGQALPLINQLIEQKQLSESADTANDKEERGL